jgi:acyl-CoA dehydrogenase
LAQQVFRFCRETLCCGLLAGDDNGFAGAFVPSNSHVTMSQPAPSFATLHEAVRRIAHDVAAKHADDVDAKARFPSEVLAALRESRLMSAPVPKEQGGSGLGMRELGMLVSALGQVCGSSAMVLAMHYNQVGSIARHHGDSPFFLKFLRDLSAQQWLVASITSEVGTFGDTRSSICAVQREGQRFTLVKEATTGSYCAHADVIVVTARRDADAGASDQVLVLLQEGDYQLEQTTTWDTMGMRGTVSPGFKLTSGAPVEQIMPVSFGDIAAQSMVPFSHILWSALWWGIAAGAHGKAATYVRGVARKNPGTTPPTAVALAELTVDLQTMRHHWQGLADEFDAITAAGTGAQELPKIGWALKMNSLKTACSDAAPRIVHGALQIVGILGYKNDSPFSMGRAYRDALSASLMISNERIAAKSAALLLVFKDE